MASWLQQFIGQNKFKPGVAGQGIPEFKEGMGSGGLSAPDSVGPINPNLPDFNLGTKYTAKDFSAPLPEYDLQRQKLDAQFNNQRSTAMDALDRRFAAMGGGPSGAQVKSQLMLENQLSQNRNQAANDIGFAEAQARRGLQSQEGQKEFQSGEAYTQRGFGASDTARQQALSLAQYNNQSAIQQGQFKFDAQSKMRQLDLARYNADIAARESAFNKELSQHQAGQTGGLFGGGGFAGLGIL